MMRSKPPVDPEGRMPLMDHIRELRRRILRAMLGLLLGMGVGFLVFTPVWDFMKRPWCRLPAAHKLGDGKECVLVYNGITEGFFLHLKIALIIGAIISSPIWLYQLWAFIAPGLYRRERKWTYVFLGASIPLFVGGALLAYLTMDKGLEVLTGFAPSGTVGLITITSYLNYMTAMMLIFGVTFELPLVVVILNMAGVLTHARIRKWRRGIIFGIFVFTAVATPSQDPFTMLALAIPTVVLFELAEILAWVHDKRKVAADPYADLSDDEASVIEPIDDVEEYEDHRTLGF
jgi:sec-independent protein translocase protein TatC